jgi:hypothetical protein
VVVGRPGNPSTMRRPVLMDARVKPGHDWEDEQ